ncbi:pentapeptide repeat-containing protein [Nonomuraea fuscirosea]|uniref:pentapeptide repeat-containing protein n=1 Tax=Nonomuraea fuscirosea TaxID=1291556 RepID=UPI002DDBD02F|nr:pentapeptide repeat-containing protein [Nonomuraea fuscirosea]WSA56746.1 pentapeptide repeat-containing protein [Nonomuraea fuscirosea]
MALGASRKSPDATACTLLISSVCGVSLSRTALAAGAGVGAAVMLLLAVRRQRHQESTTAHTTHDAAERRTTERYAKAVEQLGSDQAPVRLGGLYALDRLAEQTPALRQRVVDVICAYLRMPFTPPAEQDRREEIRAAQRAARTRARAAQRAAHAGTTCPAADRSRDPHEERQVRLTAQRILEDHLRHQDSPVHRWWQRRTTDPSPRHWADIRLDLTGAILSGVRLNNCRISEAWFVGATFSDEPEFVETTFTRCARFNNATGLERAKLNDARTARGGR